MHRPLALAAALALSAIPAQAQIGSVFGDASVIAQPTYTSINIGTGAGKRSITQFALPVVVLFPVGERLNIDVTTAFATTSAGASGSASSDISGLTDTQLRANYRLAGDQLLLTIGLNLPTGQYLVKEDQQEAAGQIGNDFLYYPISSMGNGFAATGGVAYARPVGTWNLGVGGSVRKSAEFDAFEVSSAAFRFQPADEYRLRLNADRPIGDGQVSLGLTYSAFGEDLADTTTYSTGDRVIVTGGWSFPFKGTTVFLSGWNLFRMEGQQLGGDAPNENVFNLNAALSFEVKDYLVQPSLETRLWQVGGARAGNQFNLGLRVRVPVAGTVLYPQVGFTTGNLYSTVDGTASSVSGLRLSLTARYN